MENLPEDIKNIIRSYLLKPSIYDIKIDMDNTKYYIDSKEININNYEPLKVINCLEKCYDKKYFCKIAINTYSSNNFNYILHIDKDKYDDDTLIIQKIVFNKNNYIKRIICKLAYYIISQRVVFDIITSKNYLIEYKSGYMTKEFVL